MQLAPTALIIVSIALAIPDLRASEPDRSNSHIRFNNSRIAELFRYGMHHSPSFADLVATLEIVDQVVYIEDGLCPRTTAAGCLRLMPQTTNGPKNVFLTFNSRQSQRRAVSELAHELYHAVEIGREPEVVDEDSLRVLYTRIGFRSCGTQNGECWETRAAAAFEALVMRELVDKKSN